jgi:hypothetical protein
VTNLATALAAFQSEMPTVHKGKTATVPMKGGGSYRYTYADLADVSAAATPLLSKHGLAFTCRPRLVEGGSYELVGVLTHTSGEEKEGALPIFGRTAQEIGSSITYGRRYLLGCMTGIVTDDDEDGNVATGTTERTHRQPPPETPEQRLSNARARAWSAFVAANPDATPQTFTEAYEQATARPFADAGAEDFDTYAATLTGAPA